MEVDQGDVPSPAEIWSGGVNVGDEICKIVAAPAVKIQRQIRSFLVLSKYLKNHHPSVKMEQ